MAEVIRFEWEGLDELLGMLEGADDLLVENMKSGMDEYSLLVEEGGRALAQRFGGDLEESIVMARASYESGMVIGSVGSNLIYAWRRHEEPYRMGKFPLYHRGIKIEDYYQNGLGRRSVLSPKGQWKGQMPGRKFLERAVIATETDFYNMCDGVLDATVRGERY